VDAINRPIIAYIAGSLVTGATCWIIHGHDRKGKVCMQGLFTAGAVNVYSHELNAHISGLGSEGRYTLFQHGSGTSVNLLINTGERTFSGWDQRTARQFFGSVAGRTVRFFDYQDLQWHVYTL
jgi:hypothetical protein